jgi:hypothetical protein
VPVASSIFTAAGIVLKNAHDHLKVEQACGALEADLNGCRGRLSHFEN